MKEKYDQVAIKVSEGGYNVISISEWQKMDILKRIELMKEGKVTFLFEGKIATLST